MSHFPPFYDACFQQKFNFKDWIIHFALICGPELCRQDGRIKASLGTHICGYPLRWILWFKLAYSEVVETAMKSLVQVLAYFLFFRKKVAFGTKTAKLVYLQLLIKHD